MVPGVRPLARQIAVTRFQSIEWAMLIKTGRPFAAFPVTKPYLERRTREFPNELLRYANPPDSFRLKIMRPASWMSSFPRAPAS